MGKQIYEWEYRSIPALLIVLGDNPNPNSSSDELSDLLNSFFPGARFQQGNITSILKVFVATGHVRQSMDKGIYRWELIRDVGA